MAFSTVHDKWFSFRKRRLLLSHCITHSGSSFSATNPLSGTKHLVLCEQIGPHELLIGAISPQYPSVRLSRPLTCLSGSSVRKRSPSVAAQHVTRLLSAAWHLSLSEQDRKWCRLRSCDFLLLLTNSPDGWVRSSNTDPEFEDLVEIERKGCVVWVDKANMSNIQHVQGHC